MTSQYRNAIVLVVDYLNAKMLGAYGNTWVETPNLDRLAAQSLVFEQAVADSLSIQTAYDQWWCKSEKNLIQKCAQSGTFTHFLSDSKETIRHSVVDDFEQVEQIIQVVKVDSETESSGRNLADSIEQTDLAHFFAQATDAVAGMERGSLLWLHSRGLGGVWDAPLALRQQLAHPEDPDPPSFCLTPAKTLDSKDDPDELLGYQQACAAQIVLVDEFIGVLLDLLDADSRWEDTLLCVTSSRGFPMGEHGLVGKGDDHSRAGQFLHNESLHIPILLRMPDEESSRDFQATRISNLVQSSWLNRFLESWLLNENESSNEILNSFLNSFPDPRAEWLVSQSEDAAAIQTHAWKMIEDSAGDEPSFQLFAKPDDIWEINDVSRRCPQIVEQLSNLLRQCLQNDPELDKPDFSLPEELAVRFD